MSEKVKTLDTFEGWENASEIDFFGEAPVEVKTSVDKVIEAVEAADIVEKETVDKKEKKVDPKVEPEPEIDFFTGPQQQSSTTEEAEEPDEVADDTLKGALSTKAIVEFLKSKEMIDFELEEGSELDDDLASEILEDNFDSGIEKRVGELIKDLME